MSVAGTNTIGLELGRPWALLPSASGVLSRLPTVIDPARPTGAGLGGRGAAYRTVSDGEGIAVVDVGGLMLKNLVSPWTVSTALLSATLRRLREDDSVRGVLIRFYSPGGTIDGCDALGKEIAALAAAKPTHGYCEDLCASAAVWAASQCSVLSANETAEVGSIGVYLVVADISQMAANEGVKVHRIRAGEPYKGAGVPGTKIEDQHLAKWQSYVDRHNSTFVNRVAAGRGMNIEAVRKLNDGSLWIGDDAVRVGLVDYVESFDDALDRLRSEADIVSPQEHRRRKTRADLDDNDIVTAQTAQLIAPGKYNALDRRVAVAEGWTVGRLRNRHAKPAAEHGGKVWLDRKWC